MSEALEARDIALPLALSQQPSDPETLRYVSGLSGSGHCQATGTFLTSQWPVPNVPVAFLTSQWLRDPEKCQWPGPLAFSQWPCDPVILRFVCGLSGPGLCLATGTFPTALWTYDPEKFQRPQWSGLEYCRAPGTFPTAHWRGDPEKCQWPQWPGILQGNWHFPQWPAEPVTLRNVIGLGHCGATGTFPMYQWPKGPEKCQWPVKLLCQWHFPNVPVTQWPWEMSVASLAWDITWPLALSQRPSDPMTQRYGSGLCGPRLCLATGTFPTS